MLDNDNRHSYRRIQIQIDEFIRAILTLVKITFALVTSRAKNRILFPEAFLFLTGIIGIETLLYRSDYINIIAVVL